MRKGSGMTDEQRRAHKRAYAVAYRAANPEKIRSARRAHYLANREAVLEKSRRWALANRGQVNARNAARRDAAPEKAAEVCRRGHEARRVGVCGFTAAQYAELSAMQGGVCAICARPDERRHRKTGTPYQMDVDHDHETGVVRGLLCGRCNRALGLFRDDPSALRAAAAYLERNRAQVLRA